MINLIKKSPCKHNDLTYAYNNEGEWIGQASFSSDFDQATQTVRIRYHWYWNCEDGTVHDCTPGAHTSGLVTYTG